MTYNPGKQLYTKRLRRILFVFASFILLMILFYGKNKQDSIVTNDNYMFGLEFEYIIKSRCMSGSGVKAIQIVTSFAGNTEARSALRRAYPEEELKKLGIFRVFLLGLFKPREHMFIQDEIIRENAKYRDIVQGNFIEDYRNLTYKHIMGLRYAATECAADHIIKMDDDIVVDLYSLMQLVNSKRGTYDILCNLYLEGKPIRNKVGSLSKWYVSKDEYEHDVYPPYASGWLYVIKSDAARKIVAASRNERFFWVDDVFVTGILAQKVGVAFENMGENVTFDKESYKCCIREREECWVIFGPSENNYELHIDFQQHSKLCFENKCKKREKC